jgi:hypothetical protein
MRRLIGGVLMTPHQVSSRDHTIRNRQLNQPSSSLSSLSWRSVRSLNNSASSPASTSVLPIIDMNGFTTQPLTLSSCASRGAHGSIAASIGRAVRGPGFMYLKNTPLTPSIINDCQVAAKWFFALPLNVKKSVQTDVGSSRSSSHQYALCII